MEPSKHLFESPSVRNGEEEELKFEDFALEKRLGDGAFGQVWRVVHKATRRAYAVKQVAKTKVSKMLPQFKREVFIMYQLNHPHIIKLYNHFEDAENFYLIMELAEGGNLFNKLYKEKQFMERTAAQYFREVVLAVEYLHSHVPAIIHRDIKPENILLDRDGRVKLTDFGWSNYYNVDIPVPRTTVCGTLEYLPPEIVDQSGHSTAADIWCLGVLLFEMLIGYTPFKALTQPKLLTNIAKQKPKFPPSFPIQAQELVRRMLQKQAKDRPDIREVKSHRWLQEQAPMRETLTQELAEIHLEEFRTNEEPKVVTGYQAINQAPGKISNLKLSSDDSDFTLITEADTEENVKPNVAHFDTEVMRESIKVVKEIVSGAADEEAAIRAKVAEVTAALATKGTTLEKLSKTVEAKRREIAELKANEEKLLTQIADRAVELERLGGGNLFTLSAAVDTLRRELIEKTEEVNKVDKLLNKVKTDYAILLQNEVEKDKIGKDLKAKLARLKKEMKEKVNSTFTETSELTIRASIFKAQIQSHERPKNLEQETGETLREINDTLTEMKTLGKQQSEEFTKLRKKIQGLEDCAFAREEEISKLTASYQETKFQSLLHAREAKAKIQNFAQSAHDSKQKQQKSALELEKRRLRLELDRSREGVSPVSRFECEQTREKLLNLKISHSLLLSQNRKVEAERQRIKVESESQETLLGNTASTVKRLQEES